MNTFSRPLRILACPPSVPTAGQVPAAMLSDLRQHGISTPVRGFGDPRLQYPELLLIDGWDRQDPPAGFTLTYTCSGDDAEDGGQRWQQSYQAGQDGGGVLITRCGHTESIMRRDPKGQINTSYRTV